MADNKIEFLATIPQIQSAIRFGGDGAVRVQFEIPKSERANTVGLIALDGVVLKVTVEVAPLINKQDQDDVQKGTKRKRGWQTSEG